MSIFHTMGAQQRYRLDAPRKAELLELLRSHTSPPPGVRSTMSEIAADIAQYDAELAILHARIDRVAARRAALQKHHDEYKGLFAPIRGLPAEILLNIFELYRSFGDTSITCLRRTQKSHPLEQLPLLMLAQVCIRWRETILGTPTLWNNIHLTPEWRTEPSWLRVLGLLRLALQRSGQSHLNHVDVSHGNDARALELLLQESERWETCKITNFGDLKYLSRARGRLPLLRTLQIHLGSADSHAKVDFMDTAPRLRSFTVLENLVPSITKAPFHQLESLRCMMLPSSQIDFAVSLASRLPPTAECHLGFFVPSGMDNANTDNAAFEGELTVLNVRSLVLVLSVYGCAVDSVRTFLSVFWHGWHYPA
ncbi:hypothetical protein B0H13DRAFT_1702544 [Mycena leptocephala]|nr:hypothetical protein B0H13DRAFT_1702544 [Mycena leptocephala]